MQPLSRIIQIASVLISSVISSGNFDGVQIDDITITHKFGEQLNIQVRIEPSEKIKDINVHIQTEDKIINTFVPLTLNSSGEFYCSLIIDQLPISPFSTLSIWFEVETNDEENFTSDTTKYFYEDNRYQWTTIKNDEFVISWYQDNPDLGEDILKAANEGMARIQSLLELPNPKSIQIFAYSNASDLHGALNFSPSSTSWVAGHTQPDQKVILVSLEPGEEQILEIERQIPHELTHVLLYEKIGIQYANLPQWLNEGLASTAEINPNPEYQEILKIAYDQNSLIPLETLCGSFPSDPRNVQLSYAEANSFITYLQTEFGKEKIKDLIESFLTEDSCTQGVLTTFDIPLVDLESDWHRSIFNENSILGASGETIPLLIIIVVVFIVPIGMVGSRLIIISKRDKPLRTEIHLE